MSISKHFEQTEKCDGIEVMERGDIFFLYRPKVQNEKPQSIDEIQRMYIVLRPEAPTDNEQPQVERADKEFGVEISDNEEVIRVLVVGKKSLPDPSIRSRTYWGAVDLVTSDLGQVRSTFSGSDYETKTKGTRHLPPARPFAEGFYCILKHQKKNRFDTHLVYKLALPPKLEESGPQEALNVFPEASFVIQVKNPTQPSPKYMSFSKQADPKFSEELIEKMDSLRFVPCDPVDFLNYEGCEFLLISASDNIEEELGVDIKSRAIEEADILESLKEIGEGSLEKRLLKPLLEGEWG